MSQEIVGCILGLVSVFLLISLSSYIGLDTFNLIHHRFGYINNLGGIVGAGLAEAFLGSIGIAGYVSIVICVWMAVCAFRGAPMRSQIARLLGIVSASILLAITCHIVFKNHLPEMSLLQGGFVGKNIGHFLQSYFNTTGSLLIVGTGFIVTFIMSTKIYIGQCIQSLLKDETNEPCIQEPESAPRPSLKNLSLVASATPPRRAPGRSNASKKPKATETSNDDTETAIDAATYDTATEESKTPAIDHSFESLIGFQGSYSLPSTRLLKAGDGGATRMSKSELKENSKKLCEHLLSFQITGEVTSIARGPVITTYEFKPSAGIKLSKIASLQDDLGVILGTNALRVVAPIPGKTVVGFEVPRTEVETISLKDLLSDDSFYDKKLKIPIAIGKSTTGEPVFADLTAMPHLLVAGATGSGKSVFINSLIISLLYRLSPQDLRLILVDPKMLELSVFEGVPHLITNVITNNNVAYNALAWAVLEMERRYQRMAETNSKNIESYNSKHRSDRFPYIVIVVDELADLMLSGGERVEIAITRLAQKARAAGIHLVIATQRPSTDVVTGLIKANIPSRISFKVPSGVDSRTVLDTGGAEELLGRGDSLMLQPAIPIRRLHGCFVSEEELSRVVKFIKAGRDHSKNYISFPDVMPPE